jgi:hypothetical protein
MANLPFWQSALLQIIGPGITVGFGSWAIAGITARAQRRRAVQQLRHDLIVEMAETASSMYLATQRYWRARDRDKLGPEQLQVLRTWLDKRYQKSRGRGEALQTRLEVLFGFGPARRHWHATMDLLTVRYFQLTDPNNIVNFEANAGEAHSGLLMEDLQDPKLVLDHYRKRLNAAVTAVQSEPFMAEEGAWKRARKKLGRLVCAVASSKSQPQVAKVASGATELLS